MTASAAITPSTGTATLPDRIRSDSGRRIALLGLGALTIAGVVFAPAITFFVALGIVAVFGFVHVGREAERVFEELTTSTWATSYHD
jgi:hypothetical protein